MLTRTQVRNKDKNQRSCRIIIANKQLNHGGKEGERQIRVTVVCPSVHRDLIKQPDGNNIFTGFVLVVF